MGYTDCEEEADRFAKSLLESKYPSLTLIGYLVLPIVLLFSMKYYSIFYSSTEQDGANIT